MSSSDASKRQTRKEDITVDNYRNRLLNQFGNAIFKIDGTLPSHIKGLCELTLRTWSALQYGKQAAPIIRDRTVTVGLGKVLNKTIISKNNKLTPESMRERFVEISHHVSRVRVIASLFANFLNLQALETNRSLPEADQKFFSGCLNLSRSGKAKNGEMCTAFIQFTSMTGIKAEPSVPGVSTVFERQVSKHLQDRCRMYK